METRNQRVSWHYLQPSEQGLTLFTTRRHKVAQSVAGKDVVEMQRLSDEDTISMLR